MQQKEEGFHRLRTALTNQDKDMRAPRLLVLVGIPGSGKSTFAGKLVAAGWTRVSQDDLGDRRKCEKETVRLLQEGCDVVIDRCNFDRAQRKHWVDYGRARGCVSGVVVFATPLGECMRRVVARQDHPTLPGADDSKAVVMRMSESFVFPQRNEGFAFCRIVREQADFDRVVGELEPPSAAS